MASTPWTSSKNTKATTKVTPKRKAWRRCEEYQDEKYVGPGPSHELLEACGAMVIHEETPRVVEFEGERYAEGMLEHQILEVTDDVFERHGRGRPNRTRPSRTS